MIILLCFLLLTGMQTKYQQVLIKAAAARDMLVAAVQPLYRIHRITAREHPLAAEVHLNLFILHALLELQADRDRTVGDSLIIEIHHFQGNTD